MTIRHSNSRDTPQGCFDNAPASAYCAPQTCAPTVCGDCPPKAQLRDYFLLKPRTQETSFLLRGWSCAAEVIPAHLHCVEMVIRKRGECPVLFCMNPIRADITGAAWFVWPDAFWRFGDGNFEMEIFLDNRLALVTGARVIGAYQVALEVGHLGAFDCITPPTCAPQIEDQPSTFIEEPCHVGCN